MIDKETHGEFTIPIGQTGGTYTIDHGLGEMPDYVKAWCEWTETSEANILAYTTHDTIYDYRLRMRASGGIIDNKAVNPTNGITATDSEHITITAVSNVKIGANVNYHWLAIKWK